MNKFLSKSLTIILAITFLLSCMAVPAIAETPDVELVNKFYDFENDSQLEDWDFIKNQSNIPLQIKDNAFKSTYNDSDRVLSMASETDEQVIALYKGELSNSKSIVSVIKGKFYKAYSAWHNSLNIYYYYKDSKNYKMLALAYENGIIHVRNHVCIEGYTDSYGNAAPFRDPAYQLQMRDFTGEEWLEFEITYSDYKAIFKLTQENGNSVKMDINQDNPEIYKDGERVGEPQVKLNSGTFGFGCSYINEQSFDNIAVDFVETPELSTQKYKAQYGAIINADINLISLADKEAYIEAKEAFDLLGYDAQLLLSEEKSKLDAIGQKIEDLTIKAQFGYSDLTYLDSINETFDTADILNKFYYIGNEDPDYSAAIVKDPDNPSNKVLKFTGAKEGMLKWREFAWPKDGTIKTVSFDMKWEGMPASPFRTHTMEFAYVDSKTWSRFYMWQNSEEEGYFYRKAWSNQGVYNYDEGTAIDPLDEWVTVELSYNTSSLQVIGNITPKDGSGSSVALRGNSMHQKSQFLFSVPGIASFLTVDKVGTVYYDNFKVTFEKGDWDDDINITEPTVYYNGNTWINPGETHLVYGEDLYSTVDSVEISQKENIAAGSVSPKYIYETYFDGATPTGKYIAPSAATEGVNAQNLSLLQSTEHSFKLEIPSDYSQGIYALKLKAKYTGVEDKIIYINNPEIINVLGNESEHAVAGGWFDIYGKHIVGRYNGTTEVTDAAEINASGVCVKLLGANGYVRNLDVVSYSSKYRLKANVPADVPEGTYDLVVYNGYGDETCFSAPYSVKVVSQANSLEAKRTKNKFNVKDFGATGDGRTPDTAAFYSVFEAAAKAGGGTVFVPTGTYHITNQIRIPDNVALIGEGTKLVNMVMTPYKFAHGELPVGSFVFCENVEIANMSFYAQRAGHMVMNISGNNNGNSFVHDIRVQMSPTSGMISGGSHSGYLIPGLSHTDAWMMAYTEAKASSKGILIESANSRVENNELIVGLSAISIYGKNAAVNNNHFESIIGGGYDYYTGGWSGFAGSSFIENNYFAKQFVSTMEFNGTIFAGNTQKGDYWNNREMLINDGEMFYGTGRSGVIQKIDDTHYRLVSDSKGLNSSNIGHSLFILSGQGQRQARTITEINGNVVTIDSPFVVEPNRNSRVGIHTNYKNSTIVGNVFREGSVVGLYGTAMNIVFDANDYGRVTNNLHAYADGPNWYISLVNQKYDDSYVPIAAGGTDLSSVGRIDITPTLDNSLTALVIRNNTLLNGFSYIFKPSKENSLYDVIMERNYVEGAQTALTLRYESTHINGIYIKNNEFVDCGTDMVISGDIVNNEQKSPRIIIGSLKPGAENFVYGDVNMDGTVTVKDSTLIRMYVAGMYVLTPEQAERADVNLSGDVTLLDSVLIKQYLIGKAELGKDVDLNDGPPEWIGPF